MDSYADFTPSPSVKLEASPAVSLLDEPGNFPSLFEPFSADAADALLGLDAATPATPSTPTTEKKPVKKRKSWGQVLPEPKTSLPPRKRAKTEDEKEQRRVERVLRNRRAAQSSRERKRQEVELLEKENANLINNNRLLQQGLLQAQAELKSLKMRMGVLDGASAALSTPLGPTAMTLSHDLFASAAPPQPTQDTVNLETISPSLSPIEEADEAEQDGAPAVTPLALETLSDVTQHPAAMLSSDPQCQSERESSVSAPPPPAALLPPSPLMIMLALSATLTTLLSPSVQMAMALRSHSCSTLSEGALVQLILRWVTGSTSTSTSTSASSSTSSPAPPTAVPSPTEPRSTRTPTSLRRRLLRRILSCSPTLARPLKDATVAALRSAASSEIPTVDRASEASLQSGGPDAAAPSKEVLLTLLWAIQVEEKRRAKRSRDVGLARKTARKTARVSLPCGAHRSPRMQLSSSH